MSVAGRLVGTTRGHARQGATEVQSYELVAGGLRAEVWSYGATLVRLETPDRWGETTNVVVARGTLEQCDDPLDRGGYQGATIGRHANRIAGGRLNLGGRFHQLVRNEGPNHLHGGAIGFDQYVWNAEVESEDCSVAFRLVSPDGDEGYPGEVTAVARYALDAEGLTMTYEATTTAPTVLNLTNHAYWNLAGGGTIDEHDLSVNASWYLPVDATAIPRGGPAATTGTRFDLTSRRSLGSVLRNGGLDHYYILDEGIGPAAELAHSPSGRVMIVETDQPGLQVYTANKLDPPHQGLCLETHIAPDSANQPRLGSALLLPGETYRHRTRHSFQTR